MKSVLKRVRRVRHVPRELLVLLLYRLRIVSESSESSIVAFYASIPAEYLVRV
jgi:hypothetical protein